MVIKESKKSSEKYTRFLGRHDEMVLVVPLPGGVHQGPSMRIKLFNPVRIKK